MKYSKLITWFAASLFATTSFAKAPDSANSLQDQRYRYELAKSALKNGNVADFQAHYKTLTSYALHPYLSYAWASRSLSPLDKHGIEAFIETHTDTYLGDRLHRQYLDRLAKRRMWDDLIFWYREDLAAESVTCAWLYARVKTGEVEALSEVPRIWNQAKSLPDACDPLFKMWMASSYFDESMIWDRYILAVSKGKRGLARYLASRLPTSYQHYVDRINELYARPYRISRYKRFGIHSPEMQHVIAFGVRKYARKHPEQALRHWERYEGMQIFDEQLAKDTKLYLVNQLLKFDHVDDVHTILEQSRSLRHPATIERLIRELLREQRWNDVISAIRLLPETTQQEDRWQYWLARSVIETKGTNYDALAHTTYKKLAEKRSFYGFMAADHLGSEYTLEYQPAELEEQLLDNLAKRPALARAKELWLTERMGEAYAEWYYGIDKLSSRELAAAGVLADRWGWHSRAIHTMIAGKHWNHLGIRFPLAFREHILGAAASTDLAPEFIFAVARQESAMSVSAKSSAGARGLMQLMPSTARQTARKQGIKHTTADLYSAEHNIVLGSHYLDELVEKFSGNRILAAAAYNAGPHRVNKWIQNSSRSLPFDVWIETIPYRETRGYVQNVLTFAVIYSFRMGKPETLVTKSEAKQKL